MNIGNENINIYFNKYKTVVDNISFKYGYQNNLRHVLYLVIPAFVVKYGIENESTIINCFTNIPIVTSMTDDNPIKAYYSSRLVMDGLEYKVKRIININNYNEIGLIKLIDNLIHEFNHAINSYNNNLIVFPDYIKMRIGLSYITYSSNDIKVNAKGDNRNVLEEIINTKQTENIIDILNSFNQYNIENMEVRNALLYIDATIKDNYKSHAYYYQMYISEELVNNKTFFSTIEKLRIKGNIDDIELWFDSIMDKKGSYEKLVILLRDVFDLTILYSKKKLFKSVVKNKINYKTNKAKEIMKIFNANCNYR